QEKAGVAVIRVSGPEARLVGEKLSGKSLPSRGMTFSRLSDSHGDLLDEALVVSFTMPDSFSGEDTVEFQCHGSSAVVSSILQAIEETG
ncbi:tRNA uridine-5-carboxymethylaminomethyl(34) synthesis GTPase MnmE, partial [Rhizobium sp. SIMBA_035]